jgi:pentose-5-phosphate-3-epimerase
MAELLSKNAVQLVEAGADVLVAGSYVFKAGKSNTNYKPT